MFAFAAAFGFFFAVDVNPLLAGGFRRFAQLLQVGAEAAADGLGIAEDFRIEGSEMVADAGMAVFHGVVGRGALREAGGEEFH